MKFDGQTTAALCLGYAKILRMPFLVRLVRPLVIAPVDDFLIFGPYNGLENMEAALSRILQAKPDAVLTFAGTARRYPHLLAGTRTIVNLSASTRRSKHTTKWPVHSMEEALRCHASGVAFHINLTSNREGKMIMAASRLIARAERYGMPTVGIIYPRRAASDGTDDNYDNLRDQHPDAYADLVSHCLSVGADLGFDLIKTKYTGDKATFAQALQAAGPTPVVIAGGPRVPQEDALSYARSAIESGASGISFGRNLFGRSDPRMIVDGVRRIRLSPSRVGE